MAEIFADDSGRITMVADTKVTIPGDVTQTRRIYTEPCLKIVILDDDIAVAAAGDNPATAIRHVTGLRGRPVTEIVEELRKYSADHDAINVSKSFLIAKRAPDPQLWRITGGEVEDSSNLSRLWIGDPDAFRAFQHQYAALPNYPPEQRLVSTMMTIVLFDDIPSVGGYTTRVTGDATEPFRFHSDPAGSGPWYTEGEFTTGPNGEQGLVFRVPPGGDPSRNTRIGVPGRDATFGAMAYFIPETGMAVLWKHAEPWRPAILLIGIGSMDELVQTAEQKYAQLLSPAKLPEL